MSFKNILKNKILTLKVQNLKIIKNAKFMKSVFNLKKIKKFNLGKL